MKQTSNERLTFNFRLSFITYKFISQQYFSWLRGILRSDYHQKLNKSKWDLFWSWIAFIYKNLCPLSLITIRCVSNRLTFVYCIFNSSRILNSCHILWSPDHLSCHWPNSPIFITVIIIFCTWKRNNLSK